MFIRKTSKTDRNTGKKYFFYQLIESYRTDRGPRQRILLNLGSDLPLPGEHRKQLANRIEEIVRGEQSLFQCPEDIEQLAQSYAQRLIRANSESHKRKTAAASEEVLEGQDYQTVDVNTLKHEHCRTVGTEHLVLETVKKLKLDKKLSELGFQ